MSRQLGVGREEGLGFDAGRSQFAPEHCVVVGAALEFGSDALEVGLEVAELGG